MSDDVAKKIETVLPQPKYRLLVTWRTGERALVAFDEDISKGGVWAALRDERLFQKARIADGGSVLEWPEPCGEFGEPCIDIDADGLYELAVEQGIALSLKALREAQESEMSRP